MRILYGVCGEGMGHAVRSAVLIDALKKENTIKIVSSGNALEYLKKKFDDVEKIESINIVYKNNEVKRKLTIIHNVSKFFPVISSNLQLVKLVIKFKPQIIISDFEPFTSLIGFLFRKPVISINNQDIVRTKLDHKKHIKLFDRFILKSVTGLTTFFPKQRIVTSFFYPNHNLKNLVIVPPIIRPELINSKLKEKDFILVYQTSSSNKKLLDELEKINQKFVVYGFNRSDKLKNIIFRKFNEKQFIKDLSECIAVITNGGFTVMSEALYLGKPILSEPVRKQVEQEINALYLDKLGYGHYCKHINSIAIEKFIKNINFYRKNIKKMEKSNNSKVINLLNKFISKYS